MVPCATWYPRCHRGHTLTRCSDAACFFFSSRRRHTRCSRDWSSDVCSSDLDDALRVAPRAHRPVGVLLLHRPRRPPGTAQRGQRAGRVARPVRLLQGAGHLPGIQRSEEHTSELQSRLHLVCRLLLEKNNLMIRQLLTPSDSSSVDMSIATHPTTRVTSPVI